MKNISKIIGALSCFAAAMLLYSCQREGIVEAEYGYVQFRVQNSLQLVSKSEVNTLEHLGDAKKIKVVLNRNNSTITQTMPLNSYSPENAEYGLRSEKLSLLAGEYSVVGFYLYDSLDELLISSDIGSGESFVVPSGGLVVKNLGVSAKGYGQVSFKLVKDLSTKSGADGADYPFSKIRLADITVRNTFTRVETEFAKTKVTVKSDFVTDASGNTIETAYASCDVIAKLEAANYEISAYTTYSDLTGRNVIEARTFGSSAPVFSVNAFGTRQEVQVPIKLSESAEYIKDYIALKGIWEALDGPSWSYSGDEQIKGCNWHFDRDIDLWGRQPGVNLDNNGRVSSLNLSGFGIKGNLPDCIGQLEALQVLYLGTHNDAVGGKSGFEQAASLSGEALKAHRLDYHHRVFERDVRENMSDVLQKGVNDDPSQRPIVKNTDRINLKDVHFGILTNGLTGISKALMRLKNLQQLYIANCPITSENFFTEIKSDSPFYAERDLLSWNDLETLTDIEIYNCPNLTSLPLEMLTELPDIQALNVANNYGISAQQLKSDWEAIIDGKSGAKIQILYLGHNNLREFPEYEMLKKMVKLGYIECSNSSLEKVNPFGSGVNIAQVILDYNKLTSIPAAPDGYFVGVEQLESFTASHNELTEVPDIFNAKSVYEFESVDFSHNNISSFANGASHKGINATTIDLSYNSFSSFPTQLFTSGSPCEYLIFAGNGIRKIEKGSISGSKANRLMSIDLSYNKLSSLPSSDFAATNLPYLYGMDLSYNSFDYFPTEALDAAGVTVFALRHQRDDDGNRTLRQWPTGIYSHCPSLAALYLSSNDIRKVEDTITPQIYNLEVCDNPNITMTLSSSCCVYWQAGYFNFIYDKTQDIRGCPALMQ